MQGVQDEMEQYSIHLKFHLETPPANTQERALELAKEEAFDLWLSKGATTSEHNSCLRGFQPR